MQNWKHIFQRNVQEQDFNKEKDHRELDKKQVIASVAKIKQEVRSKGDGYSIKPTKVSDVVNTVEIHG